MHIILDEGPSILAHTSPLELHLATTFPTGAVARAMKAPSSQFPRHSRRYQISEAFGVTTINDYYRPSFHGHIKQNTTCACYSGPSVELLSDFSTCWGSLFSTTTSIFLALGYQASSCHHFAFLLSTTTASAASCVCHDTDSRILALYG